MNLNDTIKKFEFTVDDPLLYCSKPELDRTMFDRWSRRVSAWTDERIRCSEPRWSLDFDVLADALDHLGIAWELEITLMHRWYSLGASHGAIMLPQDLNLEDALKIDEQVHVVTIDPGLAPEAASFCLWHELTHAKQAEQFDHPWEFFRIVLNESKREIPGSIEYYNTWWEAEAFKNMDLHYEIGSLTRPAA